MADTKYAYAVSRIRENENRILPQTVMEQLITASDFESAKKILIDHGWNELEDMEVSQALKMQEEKVWQLLMEVLPDKNQFDFLKIRNDYHNIKAVLKSMFSTNKHESCYITPGTVDVEVLEEAIKKKKYSDIPEKMTEVAVDMYKLLSDTLDGQLMDIEVDRVAMEEMARLAEDAGSDLIREITEDTIVTNDIKIAVRAARTGKDSDFLEKALCECGAIEKKYLIAAATKSVDEVCEYASHIGYDGLSEAIEESDAAFEKYCDELLIKRVEKAKFKSLGVDPLVAYYILRDMEIKNVRIILSCKKNKLSESTIRERIRVSYV